MTERTPAETLALHKGHDHTTDNRTWTYQCLECHQDWPCTAVLNARSATPNPEEG